MDLFACLQILDCNDCPSDLNIKDSDSFFFFFAFCFLGPHLRQMKVPRLGVKLELQLLGYTTAAARPDPSHICDLQTPQLMAMLDP